MRICPGSRRIRTSDGGLLYSHLTADWHRRTIGWQEIRASRRSTTRSGPRPSKAEPPTRPMPARSPSCAGASAATSTGVDAAILGIPLDVTVTNRPGARFGPQAIRRASAIFDGDPQYPFGFDIFADLAVVDYGDVALDLAHAADRSPRRSRRRPAPSSTRTCTSSRSAATTSITWPLLKAHAAKHGPLALDPVRRPPGHLGR